MMRFVETSWFTDRITDLLTDDEYRELQVALILRPELGPVMKRTGGARKARWGYRASGKRGGVRIIYYWDGKEQFYMLYAFAKNEQATLTRAQEKFFKAVIEKEFS
jgi:hypothetical protein